MYCSNLCSFSIVINNKYYSKKICLFVNRLKGANEKQIESFAEANKLSFPDVQFLVKNINFLIVDEQFDDLLIIYKHTK